MAIGKKTGGRTAGTPNKKTYEARSIVENMRFDPIEFLVHVAQGNWEKLGYEKSFETKVNMGIEYEEPVISLDQRLDAGKTVAKYVYPQLKAIEHTGKDGVDLFAEKLIKAQARLEKEAE